MNYIQKVNSKVEDQGTEFRNSKYFATRKINSFQVSIEYDTKIMIAVLIRIKIQISNKNFIVVFLHDLVTFLYRRFKIANSEYKKVRTNDFYLNNKITYSQSEEK